MGRKRNQGKARRAAKAKAREEATERENNNNLATANNGTLKYNSPTKVFEEHLKKRKCWHGLFGTSDRNIYGGSFVQEFHLIFIDAVFECDDRSPSKCLIDARNATLDRFADVWKDSAELEMAMSFYLFVGMHHYLEGDYMNARICAAFVRFLEQYIAVVLKQTQALINWPKIDDAFYADDHTLVKFFRHRIPCSCLDEKYEEVKSITKMGHCYNPQCKLPKRMTERSNTKHCSRCRCVTYCSRECQVADWSRHKPACHNDAAMIAKFEAKQQNM